MIAQHCYLSLVPGSVPPVIHVSQYDTGTRTLVFTLTDNGLDYTGLDVRIDGIKPDGKAFSYTDGDDFSISRSGNVVTSDCVTQMTAVPGITRCALVFYNESLDRIESADFVLDVKEAAIADDSTISETELPAIIELAKQEQDNAEQYMEAAEQSAEDAEAWATGKRGGTDVGSSDPTYQNNSKYYSEESGDSATLSESYAKGGTGTRSGEDADNADYYRGLSAQSATASAGSAEDAEAWAVGERGGTAVESGDPTYQNNSKHYSEESGDSATLSESYAKGGTGTRSGEDTDNADYYRGLSAQSATASAGSAEDAEAWAVGERGGTPIGSTDPSYHNNSAYYAGLAATAALQAENALDDVEDREQNISGIIDDAITLNVPEMMVDFTTGHLLWMGGKFNLKVNESTGHLLWEVA